MHKKIEMHNQENIDFIVVGAQKAGTTWLNKRLEELPEISVPPIKEIHYFDRSKEYPSPNTHAKRDLVGKLLNPAWLKSFYKRLITKLASSSLENIKWKIKYFLSTPNDEWYLSLFSNMDGISGEITPSYSILTIRDLRRLKTLSPSVKIVLLLRDPIERAWSHYRYVHKPKDYKNIKKIKSFINSKRQHSRSDYIKIIRNLKLVFNNSNLYISFYDRIHEEPEALLSEIVNFIGGDSEKIYAHCQLKAKSNVSSEGKMPEEILRFLRNKYKVTIYQLAKEYGSYPEKWKQKHYE